MLFKQHDQALAAGQPFYFAFSLAVRMRSPCFFLSVLGFRRLGRAMEDFGVAPGLNPSPGIFFSRNYLKSKHTNLARLDLYRKKFFCNDSVTFSQNQDLV